MTQAEGRCPGALSWTFLPRGCCSGGTRWCSCQTPLTPQGMASATSASSRSHTYTPLSGFNPLSGGWARRGEDCWFVLISSAPPQDDSGEKHGDRHGWGVVRGLGERRSPLPDMKHITALRHFFFFFFNVQEEEHASTISFPPSFLIWKLSNLQKSCDRIMGTFELSALIVNILLHLLSPPCPTPAPALLSFLFFFNQPCEGSCRHQHVFSS